MPSAYEQLYATCRDRGLWLELHTGPILRGANDRRWRNLERLDITSADGRRVLASNLVVNTIEEAAMKLLPQVPTLEAEA